MPSDPSVSQKRVLLFKMCLRISILCTYLTEEMGQMLSMNKFNIVVLAAIK